METGGVTKKNCKCSGRTVQSKIASVLVVVDTQSETASVYMNVSVCALRIKKVIPFF